VRDGVDPRARPAGALHEADVIAVLRLVAPLRELGLGGREILLRGVDVDVLGLDGLLDEDLDRAAGIDAQVAGGDRVALAPWCRSSARRP